MVWFTGKEAMMMLAGLRVFNDIEFYSERLQG